MEIKNKLTVTRGVGGGGTMEERRGRVKEHVQRTHGHGHCGGGLNVGGGGWVGQERVMGGKWGQL